LLVVYFDARCSDDTRHLLHAQVARTSQVELMLWYCTERSAEDQVLTVDESSVYQPPSQLQLPSDDIPVSTSDSAVSGPDSDDNSSDNSDLMLSPGPRYADEDSPRKPDKPAMAKTHTDESHVQSDQKKVWKYFFWFTKAANILLYCKILCISHVREPQ